MRKAASNALADASATDMSATQLPNSEHFELTSKKSYIYLSRFYKKNLPEQFIK